MNRENDYFADELLGRLEKESPLDIAYEAQAKSADVGFDFTSIDLAFERLTDEVREVKEAFNEWEDQKDSFDHFCDECTDVVFGVVNVIRHAGIDQKEFFRGLEIGNPPIPSSTSLRQALENLEGLFQKLRRDFESRGSNGEFPQSFPEKARSLVRFATHFINVAGGNAESVTRKNVKKYLTRCQFIEKQLRSEGKMWGDIPLENIYARWKEVKRSGL